MRLNRRLALAGLGTMAAPALLAQAPTRLRVGVIPIVDVAPLHAAMREGYFAAEGIEIDLTPAPGGAAILPALAAGTFQVGFSNTVSILLGIQEGIGFRFVAPATSGPMAPPDINALVVRRGSGLATGKDFEGKRVASNTRANIVWLRAVAWLAATGADWRRVTMVEVPFPQMADALVNRQIDGAMINEPFLSAALGSMEDRLERVAWPQSATAPGGAIAQYAVMDTWLARNLGVAARFARALDRGVDWVAANAGAPLHALISGYTRIPEARLGAMAMPVFDRALTRASIAEVHATMGRFGLGGALPAVDTLLFRPA